MPNNPIIKLKHEQSPCNLEQIMQYKLNDMTEISSITEIAHTLVASERDYTINSLFDSKTIKNYLIMHLLSK